MWFQSNAADGTGWQPIVRADNEFVYGYGEIAVFSGGEGGSQIEATGLHYNENVGASLYSLYTYGSSLSLQAPYDTGEGWSSRGSTHTGPLKIAGIPSEYYRVSIYDKPQGDGGTIVFYIDQYGYIDSPTITSINDTISSNKALEMMGYY